MESNSNKESLEKKLDESIPVKEDLPPIQTSPDLKKTSFPKITAYWEAPLPPPHVFQKYEEILPGSADRILAMAEKEAAHRRNIDHKLMNQSFVIKLGSQITGAIISLTAIIGGAIASIYGHPAAISISLGGIATLAMAFWKTKISKKEK